ncbi:hypothetical protein V8D89_007072 [Ganoderma adspersum]
MFQETLVSQPSISWFPVRYPSGYETLPYEEDAEEDSDAEYWALKPASDIEANPATHPSSASGERAVETSPQDGPRLPVRTTMLGVMRMVAILLTAGLPSTLVFSAFTWLIGGIVLCALARVPPYDTMDVNGTFRASMAGAPVISLVVGALALLDLVLRRLPKMRMRRADPIIQGRSAEYDAATDALAISSICAPLSVLAMPLGFLMMPHLATETFGVWHALAVSTTGFGLLVAMFVVHIVLEVLSHV